MNRNLFNLRTAGILLIGDLVVGVLGFTIIEGYSFVDALYMVVITISTVGYTEVQPLSDTGKIFSAIYILLNGGLIAYILAVFSYHVIQGEIFKKMYSKSIESQIKLLKNHVIICGYGRYGKEVSAHFKNHGIEYLIIDQDPLTIENIKNDDQHILFIEGDATHDEALLAANIKEARALISALPDDAENVFTVLTARQLNPKINIISRAIHPKSREKIVLAGADHVIMPDQIGGFYMATLVTKPDAVEFFSFITNKQVGDVGFEEIAYESAPLKCKDVSIRDLTIRQVTGANIIGYKDAKGAYHVNPKPDVKLSPGSSFIILGNKQQLEALRTYLLG
ncbi:MAG: hypothetical protein RLZZ248_828 [Bacteroidota bacterium]|jgi:voltage-gated potassium channel